MKLKVNYQYQAENAKLRSNALLIDAADVKAAKHKANEQLSKEHDWFRITSVVDVTMK